MATGRIKWFDPDKGFGFVEQDDGSPDSFIHRSGLVDRFEADLAEGDKVSYEIGTSPRGPVASQVTIIERSGQAARPRATSSDRGSSRYGDSGSYSSGNSYGDSSYGGSSYGNSNSYDAPRRSGGTSRPAVSTEEIENAPVSQGTVKRYDTERGFGFISPASGEADVFVHHSALGGAQVRPGDQVSFRTVPGQKGLRAERVELVNN